jgi:hypothetical protein
VDQSSFSDEFGQVIKSTSGASEALLSGRVTRAGSAGAVAQQTGGMTQRITRM